MFNILRSSASKVVKVEKGKGLLGFTNIHVPYDCIEYANKSQRDVESLRSLLLSSNTKNEVVYYVDQISNIFDYTMNSLSFIQSSHENKKFVDAANAGLDIIQKSVISFNSDIDIYNCLCDAMKMSTNKNCQEEDAVLTSLIKEYEHDGIQRPHNARYDDALDRMQQITFHYINNIRANNTVYTLPNSSFTCSMDGIFHHSPSLYSRGQYQIPLQMRSVFEAQCFIKNEQDRRNLYYALNKTCNENKRLLQDYVNLKNAAAMMNGEKNYSQLSMYSSMYDNTKDVDQLLKKCIQSVHPIMSEMMKEALELKKKHYGNTQVLNIWDESYYIPLVMNKTRDLYRSDVCNTFSVRGILEGGIQPVLQRMFDVTMEAVPIDKDELWCSNGSIHKYQIIHGKRGYVGDLYLDLYAFPGKRCASAMHTHRGRCIFEDGSIQHPSCTIVATLPYGGHDEDSFVDITSMQTLFHEFGHAMQLLLTETKYQTISGTRVNNDAVEIPSSLFEYCCGELSLLQSMNECSMKYSYHANRASDKALEWFHTYASHPSIISFYEDTLSAIIDQYMYGEEANTMSPEEAFAFVHNTYGFSKATPNCSYLHLDEGSLMYAGVKYTYPLSIMIAADIYNECNHRFNGLNNAQAGALLYKELFTKGAAIPQKQIIQNILGRPYSEKALQEFLALS